MNHPFSLDAVPYNGIDRTAQDRAAIRARNTERQQVEAQFIRLTSDTRLERVRRLYPILGDR